MGDFNIQQKMNIFLLTISTLFIASQAASIEPKCPQDTSSVCDEKTEKCCNVDGNLFCAPKFQSCYSTFKELNPSHKLAGDISRGIECGSETCPEGMEQCCSFLENIFVLRNFLIVLQLEIQ